MRYRWIAGTVFLAFLAGCGSVGGGNHPDSGTTGKGGGGGAAGKDAGAGGSGGGSGAAAKWDIDNWDNASWGN